MENEYDYKGVIEMSRKDLSDILNAGEERYIISEVYDQVELGVEVKSEVGIVRVGGHILLVVMNEDDVMIL